MGRDIPWPLLIRADSGRYAKRDSMGRYSCDGGYSMEDGKGYMMDRLSELMEEAEKPAEKEALRRCMDALKRA